MRDGRTLMAVLFDGSFEGFLCVVHAYYYDRIEPFTVQTADQYQKALDLEEIFIATDDDKALRVLEGIRTKISPEAEYMIINSYLAGESDKFTDMFRYIVLGFKVGADIDSHLQQDCVLRVHKLSRYVGREAHLLKGFCRFAKTSQGIYYCHITPVNMVLPILAAHFCERFVDQPWVIHDKKHSLAAVYDGSDYIITPVPKDAGVSLAEGEDVTMDLWVAFFNTIAIKERKNYKLQRQHIPLYFRKSITEFTFKG